jgi:hypothetical protein
MIILTASTPSRAASAIVATRSEPPALSPGARKNVSSVRIRAGASRRANRSTVRRATPGLSSMPSDPSARRPRMT